MPSEQQYSHLRKIGISVEADGTCRCDGKRRNQEKEPREVTWNLDVATTILCYRA
jgi:hypothetical protein